jgi:anti-anti-sigma factor
MDIKLRSFETNYIIDVAGEIDLYNAFRLRDAVQAMTEKEISAFILNLEKVTYIDSSGIGALLSINATLTRKGLKFCLVRLPPSVMHVLKLTGLIGLLPVKSAEGEALDAFSKKSTPEDLGTGGPRVDGKKRSIWKRVSKAIEQSKTLTVRTFSYLPRERIHIDKILAAFLKAVGMSSLGNNLSYCIHELAGNAKKANAKRLYFADKKLNILDDQHYAAGMESFRQEAVESIDRYQSRLRESGLYVKFQFRKTPTGLEICVRNNVVFTPAEKSRIDGKLAIAKQFSSLADAYTQTEDETEGAGLGLVMTLFMLRNLGFDQDVLTIESSGDETVATLTLMRPSSAPPMETETINNQN